MKNAHQKIYNKCYDKIYEFIEASLLKLGTDESDKFNQFIEFYNSFESLKVFINLSDFENELSCMKDD